MSVVEELFWERAGVENRANEQRSSNAMRRVNRIIRSPVG
jgi:hypothetical protein